MRIKGENRQRKLDKEKTKYPPAKAQKMYDRDNPKADQRHIAQVVRLARKGKSHVYEAYYLGEYSAI